MSMADEMLKLLDRYGKCTKDELVQAAVAFVERIDCLDEEIKALRDEAEKDAATIERLATERDDARSERDNLERERGDWVPGAKCSTCKGTGEDEEAHVCRSCAGTGDVWQTWEERAKNAEAALARTRALLREAGNEVRWWAEGGRDGRYYCLRCKAESDQGKENIIHAPTCIVARITAELEASDAP